MLAIPIALFAALAAAAPTRELEIRANANAYAPSTTSCPASATPLVREATSINSEEAEYVKQRKCKADSALAAWLAKQGDFNTTNLPVVGLASSGGGLRALLVTAGVVKAFDGREEGEEAVGGIYQSLTYESGLSGGAWFLSSLAGNDWPTVSYLQENLWEDGFENSLLLPANILSEEGITEYTDIIAEVSAKEEAGFDTTIVDPWGRLLSYSLLEGSDGGVAKRLSDLTTYSNFTDYDIPFPIMTAISVNISNTDQCSLPTSATQYEFTPYEYGSWETGVAAFAKTKYMGSSLSAGLPVDSSQCITQYDNLAYILGTSSDIFASYCSIPAPSNDSLAGVLTDILLDAVDEVVNDDLYALFPNPFFNLSTSPTVSGDENLMLADGGLSGQNVPIWPFIQNYRTIDVLIASDNSADTDFNWPNGTELRQTYLNALDEGLARMPFIPEPEIFVSEGLNTRATFFGCNETETMFIVYLPNMEYTYASNTSTLMLQYDVDETRGMIGNGVAIASQNGTEGWTFCLACAIAGRGEGAPEGCDSCFAEYCYYQ